MHLKRIGSMGLIGIGLLGTQVGAQPANEVVEVIGRTPLGAVSGFADPEAIT